MRILFVSLWFPYPPNNGARIRLYNFIKSLSQCHDVFLVSMLQEDSNPADAIQLTDICTVVSLHPSRWYKPGTLKSILGLFSTRPRSSVDVYDPAVETAVRAAIEQVRPDAMIASTLYAAEYLHGCHNVPSILIDHNCEFAVLRRDAEQAANHLDRLRLELSWRKAARWEADICRRFSAVVLPSEEDQQQMLAFAPDLNNVHVIPNGTDKDRYDPSLWSPTADTMMYSGALTYNANLDAIKYYVSEIYPLVKKRRPNARLRVTGRTDGIDLRGIKDCPGIELTGYVDDIRDVLYSSAACIVPLKRGGGMRLKIPEAMAAGVPVVSTSMGAEGLDCADNEHLLIADSAEAFAAAIDRILGDVELAERLRVNARRLIEQRYSWQVLGGMFVDLVEQVALRSRHLTPSQVAAG